MSNTVEGSRVGSRWGPYQLIRGCGGMGEVYEGRGHCQGAGRCVEADVGGLTPLPTCTPRSGAHAITAVNLRVPAAIQRRMPFSDEFCECLY